MPERRFEEFVEEVYALLAPKSASKGYSEDGPNGRNSAYEFVEEHIDEKSPHAHALGEIIYKAIRYARKRDKEDALKIAAWAFLIWKYHKD
jgi:hypothetical protein